MDIITQLKNDKRFYIDKWNFDRITEKEILRYKYVEIPVGRIRRYFNSKVFSLKKTDSYIFLDNLNDKDSRQKYIEYCQKYCADNNKRGVKYFEELIDKFKTDNYDPKKGVIVVNQNYFIVEGQHRSCILLKKYGPRKKINVLKIYYKKNNLIDILRNFKYNIYCLLRMEYY